MACCDGVGDVCSLSVAAKGQAPGGVRRTEDLQSVEPSMSIPGMLIAEAVAVELDTAVFVAMAIADDVVIIFIARVMVLLRWLFEGW